MAGVESEPDYEALEKVEHVLNEIANEDYTPAYEFLDEHARQLRNSVEQFESGERSVSGEVIASYRKEMMEVEDLRDRLKIIP